MRLVIYKHFNCKPSYYYRVDNRIGLTIGAKTQKTCLLMVICLCGRIVHRKLYYLLPTTYYL
jgi:hypothetical protein